MNNVLQIGFVALADCAPLVVAKEAGFFESNGLDVTLKRMSNWEQAKSKLLEGSVQAAHLLSTLTLRSSLALSSRPAPFCSAWVLSRGGNAITVSNGLWKALGNEAVAHALTNGELPHRLRLGVVERHSPHEYQLREFLRRLAIDPDDQAEWIVIAPQEMVGKLRDGQMDAFCAGEPWNQRASTSKLGALAALGNDLLPGYMEKLLAVRSDWHAANQGTHARLLCALAQAGQFLSDPANLPQAADWLASDPYVNSVRNLLLADLEGKLDGGYHRTLERPDFLDFRGGNCPTQEDGRTWLETMAFWGHCPSQLLDANLESILLTDFHRQVFPGSGT
jgi:ABC-type nitrate/sulfonate/bicarbonate transport system substrate-binding protein